MMKIMEIGKVFSVKEARINLPELIKSNKVNVITRRGNISSAVIPISKLQELLGTEKFKDFLFEVYLIEEAERRVVTALKRKKLEMVSAEEVLEKLSK